jgi:hypothetical protein
MVDANVDLVVPNTDANLREIALQLAQKLLDSTPQLSGNRVSDKSSLLLIGTHDEIDSMLGKLNLLRPELLRNQGTAQVWATKTSRTSVAIVVSVKDAAALQALMRPLPHYGGQSYLIFDGARAIEKGVWPTVPLTYRIN